MLTIEQQRKALWYAIVYLMNEISDSKKSIRQSVDEDIKNIHRERLQELEGDLATFENLEGTIDRQIEAIKNAYNTLVSFRKIVEDHPKLNLEPDWIEGIYKTLWLEVFGENNKPWRD